MAQTLNIPTGSTNEQMLKAVQDSVNRSLEYLCDQLDLNLIKTQR